MILRLLPLALLALAGAAQAKPAPAPVGPTETFHAAGAEPFWGAEVRGSRMVLETPDSERGRRIQVRRTAAAGRTMFSGRTTGGAFVLTVTRGRCSDGMSERTYPLTAVMKFPGYTMRGCGWTARRPFRMEE